jgi:hypothetical protein
MRIMAPAFLFLMAMASGTAAQELTASVSGYGALGVDDLDGELPVSAELRLTLPLTDRFAIEPFVTAGSHSNRRRDPPEGFYGAQIRQRFRRLSSGETAVFVTYGLGAYYAGGESTYPYLGHFGLGLYTRMSKRLSFRTDVQLVTFHVVPIGVRFVAGLSLDSAFYCRLTIAD